MRGPEPATPARPTAPPGPRPRTPGRTAASKSASAARRAFFPRPSLLSRLPALPRLSKILTGLVMLSAIKLGLLCFMGLDALFPTPPATMPRNALVAAVTAAPAAAQAPAPAPAPAQAAKPAASALPPIPGFQDWAELNRRKEDLDRKEQALRELEVQLDRRVKEMAALEGNLKQLVDQAQAVKDQKLRHLIDVYTNMKAKQAAEVLETLDEAIAVKILAGMKGRQAGEILTNVKPKKAASLSEQLTMLQLPPDETPPVPGGGN